MEAATEPTVSRISVAQICILMLAHGYAIGTYLIPLPIVLEAHGLHDWRTFPFLMSGIATFISPLIVGSLADRRFAPERLLSVIVFGGACLLTLVYSSLRFQWGTYAYLGLVTVYQLWVSPGWGLLNTIGLMHLKDPQREFGPIRVWATIGFMLGGLAVSKVFAADKSSITGYIAAAIFFLEAIYLWSLPPSYPQASARAKNWREALGWDAFRLLKDRNHRTIFLASALYNIPLCGFYIYSPLQLQALADPTPSATMTIAQIMEIVLLLGLGAMMGRVRLKWLMAGGIFLGAVRYYFYMQHTQAAMMAGLFTHGLIFAMFFMTTQIYIEQRIDHAMRNQAQALMSLMTNGVGALAGFGLLHWWYNQCDPGGHPENWPLFWQPSVAAILATLAWFLWSYKKRPEPREEAASA
jgi:hypothetical protein